MDAIKEVTLQFLFFKGTLDAASYVYLARVLSDPVSSRNLLSHLRELCLPVRSPAETEWRQENGDLDPADAVCDCNAVIMFTSSKHQMDMSREIGVMGRYDARKDLAFGTPYRIIKDMIRLLGVKHRHVDSLSLYGEHHRQYRPQRTYDNPFVGYGLHIPNKPLHLSKLVIFQFDLGKISPSMITSFLLSGLLHLELSQCMSLAGLLDRLIGQVKLETLEIENPLYNSLHEADRTSIQHFLTSFSSLRTLAMHIHQEWDSRPLVDSMELHKGLKTCVFSLGRNSLNPENLSAIRINNPAIKTLGIRISVCNFAFSVSTLLPETAHHIRELAAEVVQFPRLEKWQIMCNPPITPPSNRTLEWMARVFYGCCANAVSSKIKVISIAFRNYIVSGHASTPWQVEFHV
jgi:hypothetical protein